MVLDALVNAWVKSGGEIDAAQSKASRPTPRAVGAAIQKVHAAQVAVEAVLPEIEDVLFGVELRLFAKLEAIAAEKERKTQDENDLDVARPFAPDENMNLRSVRSGRPITAHARAEMLLDGYLDLPTAERHRLIAAISTVLFGPQSPEQVRQRLRGYRARTGRNSSE